MRKIVFKIIFVGLLLGACYYFYTENRIRSRKHLLAVYPICNSLKIERFKVSSLTDLYSEYLTDSSNFRVFIDTYHYYEYIEYECRGDSIFVKKYNTDEAKPQLIDNKFYLYSSLKKKANYR